MNKAQRELKKHVTESMSVDKVTCRADGTVELRRHYFYRHGMTAMTWGDEVSAGLPDGWKVVRTQDQFQSWPQDGYFLAVVAQVVGSDNSVGNVCVPRRIRR